MSEQYYKEKNGNRNMENKLFKLDKGDKIGITACSNGISNNQQGVLLKLQNLMNEMEIECVFSDKLYRKDEYYNGSARERAEVINNFYKNKEIKAIFDVSGGDLSNGILEYADKNIIIKNYKPFFGYSDLTAVINAFFTLTGKEQYLYQIRNIAYDEKQREFKKFVNTFFKSRTDKDSLKEENHNDAENNKELLKFKYKWLQGKSMKGIVIGGNIRCFLKLAGTPFMPDFENRILFLEAMSGNKARIDTFLTQLKNMGVFKKINGIVLGTFTELQQTEPEGTVEKLVLDIINNEKIPVIKTEEIGHASDSKCLVIGAEYNFK